MFLRSEDEAADGGRFVGLEKMWVLSQAWYGDRVDAEYRPRPVSESQRMLRDVGLIDDFWTL